MLLVSTLFLYFLISISKTQLEAMNEDEQSDLKKGCMLICNEH